MPAPREVQRTPRPDPFPEWREQAACAHRRDIDWFASPEHDRTPGNLNPAERAAIKVCLTECPVLAECRRYALGAKEIYGIWAGLVPEELRRLHKRRRATA